MIWCSVDQQELPQRLFDSQTLKHPTLINQAFSCRNSCTPNTAWDLPDLETLNLTCIRLGDGTEKNLNLFFKCVNLKDLTLHRCSMKGFNVCVSQLSGFTITEASVLPKVFNMDAPQLETLTPSASVSSYTEGLNSCSRFLHLSTIGFSALEKVNIFLSNSRFRKERHVHSLLELFRILCNVKFFILDVDVIEVPQKRSLPQVHSDTVTKKVAKLEAEEKLGYAKLKDMLEAQNLQHEKLISQIIKCKMAELKLQVEIGNPDYEVLRSVGADIKSAMNLIPSSLRANVDAEFSSLYEELKCVLLTLIDASQWTMIETGLGIIRLSEGSHSDHYHSWPHVHAAKLPATLGLPPANMTASSGVCRQEATWWLTLHRALT